MVSLLGKHLAGVHLVAKIGPTKSPVYCPHRQLGANNENSIPTISLQISKAYKK
jgi:hypothetical protein